MPTPRARQLEYVTKVLSSTGWTRTDLALRAGLDPSTLSRFLNGEREDHVLREATIARLAQASGVTVSGMEPVGGFAEGEAEPVDLSANHLISKLIAELPGVIDAWTLNSRALETAGYRPGDTLFVRLDETPVPSDVVCAQIYDWSGAKAETVFRLYQPPALLAASNDTSLLRPHLLDSNAVSIKGVVVHSLRSRR